jgi:hypothetical protein
MVFLLTPLQHPLEGAYESNTPHNHNNNNNDNNNDNEHYDDDVGG